MMIAPLLLSLAVSLPAAPASAARAGGACQTNSMTKEWEKISFALWLTDYTIPDSSPREATLAYSGCEEREEWIDEARIVEEVRTYASADGRIAVQATTDGQGESGATTLTLMTRDASGAWRVSAVLGTFGHHKVFYKGTGYDKVSIRDWRHGGETIVKNVFVIPAAAVVKPSCDDVPTGNDCR